MTGQLYKLTTIKELTELLNREDTIELYGAGYYLQLFLKGLEELKINPREKVKSILVSNMKNNPERIANIPVMDYQKAEWEPGDYVILTLGHRYTDEIYQLLRNTGANIVQIDFNMFQEATYQEVEKSIQPFIDHFPQEISELNQPSTGAPVTAWTCWWQGEEQAPEMIRICIESQRRNIPSGVRHIVVTERNYKEYVTLPDYIIEKVKKGKLSLAHLADILRSALLYKYGGFWMDADVFVHQPLSDTILDYEIYTRNLPEVQFCTKAMWTIGFLYTKPGNRLFLFVMEGFFYYFSKHDSILCYFMMDYLIAIACNMFPEIEKQLQSVPYNNGGAFELVKHLNEVFDKTKFEEYIKGTSIQVLTQKIGKTDGNAYLVYDYLIDWGRNKR